ncbi:MAG: hypothetical protein COA79_05895 [Planctomycetota bacterium]|nr:MAG: hypothetical protein COA79_05895 [Planctomycetota bacterium]
MELKPGIDLGQYIIEKEIASGGMGQVFEAKEKSLGRKVAIKTIKHLLLDKSQMTQRFKNEAKIVAQLNHPNIVTIHSFVEDKYFDYIVMEYVNGNTLHELIEKNELNIEQKVGVFKQILNGIQAAHQVEIIHRDLKPNNIMLDQNNTIKILDFGLAKTIDTHDNSFTSTNAIVGTTYYLSPEVAKGEKPSKLSDLYSAGIVLYELFTGDLPFKADTPLGTIEKIKSEILTPPNQLNPNIPAYISKIILKMCEKDPTSRYQNITEVQNDLKHPHSENKIQQIRKPNPTESFISLGFQQNEVDEVIQIARELQEKKDNQLGRSTILSIGEELHIDPDIIDKAAKRYQQKKAQRSNQRYHTTQNNLIERPAGSLPRLMAYGLDFVFIILFFIPTLGLSTFIYIPICHKLFNGQTFGQMLFGIRTVSCNGKPLTFNQIVVDYCGHFFIVIDIVLGIFLCWDKDKQRLMQSVANTKVISLRTSNGNIALGFILSLFLIPLVLLVGLFIVRGGIPIGSTVLLIAIPSILIIFTLLTSKIIKYGKAITTTAICLLLFPIVFLMTMPRSGVKHILIDEDPSSSHDLLDIISKEIAPRYDHDRNDYQSSYQNTNDSQTTELLILPTVSKIGSINFTIKNEAGELISKALITWISQNQIIGQQTFRNNQRRITQNGKIRNLAIEFKEHYYFLIEEEFKHNYQPMLIGPVNIKDKKEFNVTLYNGRKLLLKVVNSNTKQNIKGANFSYIDNNNKIIKRTNWTAVGLDSKSDEKGFLPETQWPLNTFALTITKKGYQTKKIMINKDLNQNKLKVIELQKID